ncbi:MAG: amidohydrolase [Bacillota bacterium]
MELLLKNCILPEATDTCDILIKQGIIAEIGRNIQTDGSCLQEIDLKNLFLYPGFIDCHTHLGIIEEATGKIGVDNNETSDAVTPHLRGLDAINPFDIAFGDAVRSGITVVMSGPGSNNAVGGQNIAIKTYGKIIDRMLVKSPAGFKVAFGENPIGTYGKNDKCPVTRMGTAALIRELFMRAEDYMHEKELGNIKERNIRLEAVIPVLKGDIPLRAHAHRADDIATAIRIADEFGIRKLVIEHGTEANLIKEYLIEKQVPVAYGPMLTPRIKMELKRRHYSSVMELVEAGIKVALITDHPYNSIDQLRTVTILGISEGLARKDALKCLTTHPSEILECSDRIGSISVGYDADFVVFDNDAFEMNSKVVLTIIDGKVVYKREE